MPHRLAIGHATASQIALGTERVNVVAIHAGRGARSAGVRYVVVDLVTLGPQQVARRRVDAVQSFVASKFDRTAGIVLKGALRHFVVE